MRLPRSGHGLTRALAAAAVCSSVGLTAVATTAGAERGSHLPSVHPRLFASAPPISPNGPTASKPDDITKLGRLLYVTYQNNAGKDGTPPGSMSTIVAFDSATGQVVAEYILPGRCDGLTADPRHHRLLASVNEDNNSSLFVITPGDPAPAHYTYSPDPAQVGTDGVLNGGTDAISVAPDGTIYIAHSNPAPLPDPNNPAAVYTVTLSDSTAHLKPLFGVNDQALVINRPHPDPRSAALGLTDPDSNRYLADLNGGTLIQDAQADSKLVFASHLHGDVKLRQLLLTNATGDAAVTPQLDDIEQVHGRGVLYAVDQGTGNIYAIDISPQDSDTFFVSQPKPSSGDLANTPALGVVDIETGVVTHVDSSTFASPKGLLFVSAGGRDPE